MTANATSDANLLQTKQHFQILDGLRGIAAIAVVIFHFMEMAIWDYSENFIGHGFLAVDFFFCLSGFVIAYAYDSRIAKIKLSDFALKRLIRLHPLVILGSVLGLVTFLLDPFSNAVENYSTSAIILMFLASIFFVPYPLMKERAFNNFNLNAPSWSLFWEYVANILYALFVHKLPRIVLATLTIIGAALMCYIAFVKKDVSGGWGGPNFWDGGIRVLFSFTAGMLIFRYKLIVKNNLGFAALAVMLFLSFIFPYSKQWNHVTEPIIVIIYYPLLISLGAGAKLRTAETKLCKFSGDISYPLYMTHYLVIWMFASYYTTYKPSNATLAMIVALGVTILIALAYFWLKVYDEPIRKYFNKRLNTIG